MCNKKRFERFLDYCSISARHIFLSFFVFGLVFVFAESVFSQKIALLIPEKNNLSKSFVPLFEDSLSKHLSIVNLSLSESVLKIKQLENPYNLTTEQSKNLGISIGCNFFIVIKTNILRRSSFERRKYFESFATLYLISSRTGRLVFWKHTKYEEDTPQQAKNKLFDSIGNLTLELSESIKTITKKELAESDNNIPEFPNADSPEATGIRPPLPYKRIKPTYNNLAALYNIVATVDVLVDISESGKVMRTEIVRWAGFGLDESVIKTVHKMNWRPADRNGRTLPMRILLRYNFKNIETN